MALVVTSRLRLASHSQSSRNVLPQQLGRAALPTQHKLACSSEQMHTPTPQLPRQRNVTPLSATAPVIATAAVEVNHQDTLLQEQLEAPSQSHLQQESAGPHTASLPTHMTSLLIRYTVDSCCINLQSSWCCASYCTKL